MGVVIGVGVTIALIMLFTAMVDREKHAVIRNFLLVISIPFLFVIPSSLVLDQEICEVVLNDTATYYRYGSNFSYPNGSSTYHWDYGDPPTFLPNEDVAYLFHTYDAYTYTTYCYEQPNGSRAFLLGFTTVIIVFMLYIGFRFFGDVLKWFQGVVRKN